MDNRGRLLAVTVTVCFALLAVAPIALQRRHKMVTERHTQGWLSGSARDESSLQYRGVAFLLFDKVDRAIALLEEVARAAPTDAPVLNDLSVAYLERATGRGSGRDLVLAFERAEDALRSDPNLVPASFNRAAILERLGLRSEALIAWNECARRPDDDEWAHEAAVHVERLTSGSTAGSWEKSVLGFDQAAAAADSRQVRAFVQGFPQQVRMHFEDDMLKEWARSKTSLDALRVVSLALRDVTGNVLPERTVAAITGSQDGDALRRAHLAYADAIRSYRAVQMSVAATKLAHAEELLRQAGSPFADVALFYRAAAISYGSDASATLRLLREAALRAQEHGLSGSPLEGHIEWMRGKSLLSHGLPYASLSSLQSALKVFERSGEADSLAGIHDLLAWNYEFLGDEERAWSHYLTAVTLVAGTRSRRRQRIILHDIADYAMTHARPRTALVFSSSLLRMSRGDGDPSDIARSLLDRSRALSAVGAIVEAGHDLNEARTLESHISDQAVREDLQADLAVAEAETAASKGSAEDMAAFDRAIAVVQRLDRRTVLPRLWIGRAEQARKASRPQEAERSLHEAITLVEWSRGSVADPDLQVEFAEEWYRAFDAMVELMSEQGRMNEALAFVERSRSRVLLAKRRDEHEAVSELAARIPPNAAVLVYASREGSMNVWIVRRDGTTSVPLALPRVSVERMVDAWSDALASGAPAASEQDAMADLYDAILRPLLNRLRPGERLIFSPDQSLQRVPFAALYDRSRRRWLIEDYSVGVTPSLALFVLALERDETLASVGRDSIAIFADPVIDHARFPNLPDLRSSADEARAIAPLYPHANARIGALATRARFLDEAGNAAVVHVAAHAVANRRFPSRSALVLSPDDASGDGVLYAFEVEQRAFRSTRLLVLAACSTASSRDTRYEGRLGLATSFLRAGIPEVVATLWDVDDQTSRKLQVAFHERLRAGDDALTALRAAQLSLLRNPDQSYRRVAAWAGFQVVGGFFER